MATLLAQWQRFARSRPGRIVLKVLRVLFLVGILGYLGYKLLQIGWEAVWQALPTHPLFYLLFLALYFLLPLTEVLIYRITWPFNVRRGLSAFVKKRILNKEVMGYAGEVYFFTWARRNVERSDADLARTIRDNNIISSAASTLIALVLLGVFLVLGHVRITDLLDDAQIAYVLGGGLLLVLLVSVALRFRKYFFAMPARTALVIFAIQCGRLVLGQGLQIGQWAVVMPEVPLSIWFTFAAVSIILTRIPFLPSQNLLFMGVGVELSGSLGIPEAAMFSMLGVLAALDKVLSFVLYILLSVKKEAATVDGVSPAAPWLGQEETDPSSGTPESVPEPVRA